MLKDVTLGQFFPGSSIVHRLDPRCKFLLTIVYIAALFTAQSYVSYAVMLIVTGVCITMLIVVYVSRNVPAMSIVMRRTMNTARTRPS